jgi:hypothetical protein
MPVPTPRKVLPSPQVVSYPLRAMSMSRYFQSFRQPSTRFLSETSRSSPLSHKGTAHTICSSATVLCYVTPDVQWSMADSLTAQCSRQLYETVHEALRVSNAGARYAARGLRDFCEPPIPQILSPDIAEWRTRDLRRGTYWKGQ